MLVSILTKEFCVTFVRMKEYEKVSDAKHEDIFSADQEILKRVAEKCELFFRKREEYLANKTNSIVN